MRLHRQFLPIPMRCSSKNRAPSGLGGSFRSRFPQSPRRAEPRNHRSPPRRRPGETRPNWGTPPRLRVSIQKARTDGRRGRQRLLSLEWGSRHVRRDCSRRTGGVRHDAVIGLAHNGQDRHEGETQAVHDATAACGDPGLPTLASSGFWLTGGRSSPATRLVVQAFRTSGRIGLEAALEFQPGEPRPR